MRGVPFVLIACLGLVLAGAAGAEPVGSGVSAAAAGAQASPTAGSLVLAGVGGSWLLLHIPVGLQSLSGNWTFEGFVHLVGVESASYNDDGTLRSAEETTVIGGDLGTQDHILGVVDVNETLWQTNITASESMQVGPTTTPYYLFVSTAGFTRNWTITMTWTGTSPGYAYGNTSYIWGSQDFAGTRAHVGAIVRLASADVLADQAFTNDGIALGFFDTSDPIHPLETITGPTNLACPCAFMNPTGPDALRPGAYTAHLTQVDVSPLEETHLMVNDLPANAFDI
jgi:hypothetical protein